MTWIKAPRHEISRRGFLQISAAGALASALLSACAPAAPSSTSAGGAAKPAPAAKGAGPLPTYIPVTGGAKPDYHTNDPRYDDGFDNFPEKPFKAVAETPGTGSTVNILNRAYFPPPTP